MPASRTMVWDRIRGILLIGMIVAAIMLRAYFAGRPATVPQAGTTSAAGHP